MNQLTLFIKERKHLLNEKNEKMKKPTIYFP